LGGDAHVVIIISFINAPFQFVDKLFFFLVGVIHSLFASCKLMIASIGGET
jgi:hypothetical protein